MLQSLILRSLSCEILQGLPVLFEVLHLLFAEWRTVPSIILISYSLVLLPQIIRIDVIILFVTLGQSVVLEFLMGVLNDWLESCIVCLVLGSGLDWNCCWLGSALSVVQV